VRQRTFEASAVAFVLGLVIALVWSFIEGYGFLWSSLPSKAHRIGWSWRDAVVIGELHRGAEDFQGTGGCPLDLPALHPRSMTDCVGELSRGRHIDPPL